MAETGGQQGFPREFPGVHYYGAEEEEAALRVIRGKSPFRYYGANFLAEADSLEKEFARFMGRKYAQAVSCCTNGLYSSMAALGVGPGQEVLVPGFFWVATASAIVRAGAIPVLVEVDDSFTMDPADLERKITPKTRAIMPVHMCGVPSHMPAIMELARKRGIAVVEDCAQAIGATLHGTRTGAFGDLAVFSFQMNKNITAGEGGIVVTDDERLYQRVNAAHDVGVPWINGLPVQESEHCMWGVGGRMTELGAAIVRVQLRKLDQIVTHMHETKRRIKEALRGLAGVTWRRVDDPAGDSGPFILAMFPDATSAAAMARQASARGLTAAHLPDYGLHVYYNVRALVNRCSHSPDGWPWTHPANVTLLRQYGKGALPQTDALLEKAVAMPVPSCMDEAQEKRYVSIFREAHKAAGLGG